MTAVQPATIHVARRGRERYGTDGVMTFQLREMRSGNAAVFVEVARGAEARTVPVSPIAEPSPRPTLWARFWTAIGVRR